MPQDPCSTDSGSYISGSPCSSVLSGARARIPSQTPECLVTVAFELAGTKRGLYDKWYYSLGFLVQTIL